MSWKGVKQGLTFCFLPLSSIHRGRHHPFSHQCPLPPRGCTITLQNQEGPPSQEQPLTKTPEATVRWIPVSHLGHQDLTQAHSRKSAICTVNRPHSQDRTTAPDLPPSSRYKPGDAARRQGRGDLTSSPQGCARGFGQKAPGAFLLVTKPSPLHSLVPVFLFHLALLHACWPPPYAPKPAVPSPICPTQTEGDQLSGQTCAAITLCSGVAPLVATCLGSAPQPWTYLPAAVFDICHSGLSG